MNTNMLRNVGIAAAAFVVTLGGAATAQALWSTGDTRLDTPAVSVGSLAFGATSDSLQAPVMTVSGEPVTIDIPSAVTSKLADAVSADSAPIIWRFAVQGRADGITGLTYTVTVPSQTTPGGALEPITDGHAAANSLLGYSTLQVYPQSAGGDCTAPENLHPAGLATTATTNVYVYQDGAMTLQAPNAEPGSNTQFWCAQLQFNVPPDGFYANNAFATGLGLDGTSHGALSNWNTGIMFPPSLPSIGWYKNLATATGTAMDDTQHTATGLWDAQIFPDPSHEPSIQIQLTPVVTNVNPAP